MPNYIFLDVDEVIATMPMRKKATSQEMSERLYQELDDTCIATLKTYVDKLNAKIVISSTWRKYDSHLTPLKRKLQEFGLTVEGVTPSYVDISDRCRSYRRDDEILFYCQQHNIPREAIYVIDDDIGDLTRLEDRLIRVKDPYNGLKASDFEEASVMQNLNNEGGHTNGSTRPT